MKFTIKHVSLVFYACAAVLFMSWAAYDIQWRDMLHSLPTVSVWGLVALLVARLSVFPLLGARTFVLSHKNISLKHGICAGILCLACNNIFPARMGEVSKFAYLRMTSPSSSGACISFILLERCMDVLCLLGLIGIFCTQYIIVWFQAEYAALGLNTHIVLQALIGIFFISVLMLSGVWYARQTFFSWVQRVCPKLYTLCHDIYTALCNMRCWDVSKALLYTIGLWASNFIYAFLLLYVFLPMPLPLYEVGIFCVILFCSIILFLIPGGYGIMEGTVTALLVMLGCDKTQAFTVALWARVYYSLPPLALATLLCFFPQSHMSVHFLQKVDKKSV